MDGIDLDRIRERMSHLGFRTHLAHPDEPLEVLKARIRVDDVKAAIARAEHALHHAELRLRKARLDWWRALHFGHDGRAAAPEPSRDGRDEHAWPI